MKKFLITTAIAAALIAPAAATEPACTVTSSEIVRVSKTECPVPEGRALQNATAVEHIYTGLLRRFAEPDGLVYWTNKLNCGESLDAIVRGVMASAEYRKANGR